MRGKPSLAALIAGSLLLAALMFGLMAAPGFLTDFDSTVPLSIAASGAAR